MTPVPPSTPSGKPGALHCHSSASTFGDEDGKNIPLELHLDVVARIVRAVVLAVTMDFEAGYGDAGETARGAIEVGVVGANLEDQMKPLDESVAAVEAVVRAGRDAGIDFVLNARADRPVRRRCEDGPAWRHPSRSAGAAPPVGRSWEHSTCSVGATSAKPTMWASPHAGAPGPPSGAPRAPSRDGRHQRAGV